VSETESSLRSTASGHRDGAASNPALRPVCPQRQGAGSPEVRAPAPQSPFDVTRHGYTVGTAVLDAVLSASAGPTAVVLR
jgi:hypothetical protein